MKENIFPFTGKGWLRASIRKMQNQLILALLHRFIPFVPCHTFGFPFGLPGHLQMIAGETSFSPGIHYPAMLFLSGGISFQTECLCMRTGNCQCLVHEDFPFDGNTLTSFPIWRNN